MRAVVFVIVLLVVAITLTGITGSDASEPIPQLVLEEGFADTATTWYVENVDPDAAYTVVSNRFINAALREAQVEDDAEALAQPAAPAP